MMFRPLQAGVVGLHTATDAAIKACDVSMQQRMYGNIVFIGTQRERIRGIV
jgi:actin-related protein